MKSAVVSVLLVLAAQGWAQPVGREKQARDQFSQERRQLGLSLGIGAGAGDDASSTSYSDAAASQTSSSYSDTAASAASSYDAYSASESVSASSTYSASAASAASATVEPTSSADSPSEYASASPSPASAASISPSPSPVSVSAPDVSSMWSAAESEISAASASTSASGSATAAAAAATQQINPNACGSDGGDAPYSLSCGDLESVITFPNGFNNRPGGVVFLVHGTGSTGEETWGPGPYNTILPNKGPGYDIAWFTSPTRSLGDAQVTAEYIAYNIKRLAQMSSTGKVFIIGHSQGNINIQWALAFWPSTRNFVTGFSSLAGDFEGTAEGPLLCTAQDLLQGGCEPSVIQQSVGSRYLAAQNARGGSALVPTTSIFTTYDEIIQPEVFNPTSELAGAEVIRLQDVCTPAYITDHFGITVAAPAFYLTLNALENGGVADRSAFDLSQCLYLTADSTVPNPFVTIPGVIKQIALDAISVVVYEPKEFGEPRLMSYVCETGAASTYCATN